MTSPPFSPANTALDAQVRRAWQRRKLSDGTRLDLEGADLEQTFKVAPSGTFIVPPRERGNYHCTNGVNGPYAKVDTAKIIPDAGGHTHPEGKYGLISSLPGPEDGKMAMQTGKPAYIISTRRAFAIELVAGSFNVRVVAGAKLSRGEQRDVVLTTGRWNLNGGGSGVQCTFVPD